MTNHHDCRHTHAKELTVLNIHRAVTSNTNFRTTLWTGQHLQATAMTIPVNGDIGAEIHCDVDQFIRIESGRATVYTGPCRHTMCETDVIGEQDAVIIPAGTWHNIVNNGPCPLQLYTLYAPPQHAPGTVHKTKQDASLEDGH